MQGQLNPELFTPSSSSRLRVVDDPMGLGTLNVGRWPLKSEIEEPSSP